MKKIFVMFALASFIFAYSKGICLAQESLTLQLAKEKVNAAVKLIETEGKAAFPTLRDPNGEFRFADGKGYIWIHSMSGMMLVHPTRPELEGQDQLELKDSKDFYFIKAMNQLVKTHKEGWVVYLWAKPGKKIEELKGSFVKLAVKDGNEYVVGCGMYSVSKDYIRSVYPQDIIYDSDYSGSGL